MTNYHGVELPKEEVQALEELENLLGEKIPKVKEIEGETFGYTVKGRRIEGLGLYLKRLTSSDELILSKLRSQGCEIYE